MVSPSQEQIRAQIDKLLPEYAPGGKFARGEQGSFKDFAKEQAKGIKKAGIGVAVGTAAIPSDLLELNKLVNDLAINYGSKNISAIAKSVQPQINFLQQKFGRDKFDQMLNSIGIPSDASDPAQMTGEIISGFISGKALVKGLQTGIKKSLPKEKINAPKSKQVYKEPLKIRPKDVTLKPTTTYTKNVYHLGKGKIEGDKFNLMGESDFGIHVGTKGQADTMNKIKYGVVEPTMKPTLEFEGKEYKALGQRTFPLQIADDLKPARIPDIESFKMPNKWLDHLAVASDDKAGMDYMTQTTEAKLDLKNRPQVEYKGVTYYMSDIAAEMDVKNYDPKLKQSMVREKMDEQLWKDLVLSALEEQTRRKKNKSLNFKERQVWFNKIKEVANKNGYDSFIYKNTGEQDQLDMNADSYMLLEQDQLKYKFSKAKTKGDPRLDKYKGGMI